MIYRHSANSRFLIRAWRQIYQIAASPQDLLRFRHRHSQLSAFLLNTAYTVPSCLSGVGRAMATDAPTDTDGVSLFREHVDRFQCIILDLRKPRHECLEEEFERKLSGSLESWKASGARAVSVFIPAALSARIPVMVKLGFDFHHANPGYVLMLKWLSETDNNNFPAYANQYLGVAGFVVNDKGEVLVIRERFTGVEPKWKLPGGGADAGEDLAVTAQREVQEETGISSEFVGILCCRHQHEFRYGCSDMYYVCLMRATNTDISMCEQEVLECRWMEVAEFGMQDVYPTTQFVYESYIKYLEDGLLIEPTSILSYTGKSRHVAYRAAKMPPAAGSETGCRSNSNL